MVLKTFVLSGLVLTSASARNAVTIAESFGDAVFHVRRETNSEQLRRRLVDSTDGEPTCNQEQLAKVDELLKDVTDCAGLKKLGEGSSLPQCDLDIDVMDVLECEAHATVSEVKKAVKDKINGVVDDKKDKVDDLLDGAKEKVDDVIDEETKEKIDDAGNEAKDATEDGIDKAGDAAGEAKDAIGDTADDAIDEVGDWLSPAPRSSVSASVLLVTTTAAVLSAIMW